MKNNFPFIWVLMGISILFAAAALTWIVRSIAAESRPSAASGAGAGSAKTGVPAVSIYDFSVQTIDGKTVSLEPYRGKTLLIVNTASRCGFTPQYAGLEKLYAAYRDRGFEVLAFPANNFMGQEPGTDAEIKEFCALKYKTTFQIFSKISVKGEGMHPLYRYLTTQSGYNGDIGWNFTKFLVGPDGRVVARFGSKQDPMGGEVVSAIESALARN
jgi:glutathione peroxidase